MLIRKQFKLDEIIEGAYYPGVFLIKLKMPLHDEMKYDEFDEESWRTFVHEYTHFLQDISTSHGYLYYFFKSQLLNLAFYSIANNSSDIIELPIRTEETGIKDASEKEMLLDFYEGDSFHFRYHHINEIKMEADDLATGFITDESVLDQKLYSINIYYDNRAKPYQFGNECIIESMAYLIERHLLGAEERINEFPYNACETICQFMYPELLEHPNKIVMLGEVALMHDDCGLFFHGLVNLCAQRQLAELTDDDFREFCINNINKYIDRFELAYKEAIDGIDILFPERFAYTVVVNEQLKVFLECGHNYRKSKPLFISDVFLCEDCTLYFKQLIRLFDIPMLIDGKDDYYGKQGVQNIPVADAVLSILCKETGEGCKLQLFCKKSGISCYDELRCTVAPWENCKCEGLCPVAEYFKGYGIDKKAFKWRVSPGIVI